MSFKSALKSFPFLRNLAYQFLFWSRENDWIEKGKANKILAEGARLEHCKIRITGSHNRLIFEPGASVRDCEIEVIGDHHELYIGENVVLTQSILWFEDHHCQIRIGSGTTMQRFGHIAVTEPNRKIEIGRNCMFSFSVDIRNGDSHSTIEPNAIAVGTPAKVIKRGFNWDSKRWLDGDIV